MISFRVASDEKATPGAFVDIKVFLILRKNQSSGVGEPKMLYIQAVGLAAF